MFFNARKKTVEAEEVLPPVKILTPELGSIQKNFRVNGFLESESMITVTPKTQGLITRVFFDTGDVVSKGAIIAEIDPEPYRLQLEQAEAGYIAIKNTFDRVSTLYQSGSASRQNYDQVKGQFDAAKSQYELAKLQLEYTRIESPISGTILVRHISQGAMAGQTTPLFTVGNLNDVQIRVQMPEQYYALFLRQRDSITIQTQIPALENAVYEAELKTVSPYISPETRNFEVICTISDDKNEIRPGMFTKVIVNLEKRDNVYSLPYECLVGGTSLWYLEGGKAKILPYTVIFEGDSRFQISDEYAEYLFLYEGQHFLRDGIPVTVIHENY
ncbi:efflux RND transporter periplasmic adaptor subunit [Brucepastera parasyntrophica]|uniref:efflux RND transporter periplasmic adaptor subunit n=1 Tax=Brucepastera parasyntrophica TaxID=2880008 RepID=UPI002108648D|nr:efflux RND transporter periplasmic adaptor subunit [Brucepastera parasyntrophica]ULQ58682.1 efflux RND transporter periplasmic adaptor subunit [Brucepastera parasyntrophica]